MPFLLLPPFDHFIVCCLATRPSDLMETTSEPKYSSSDEPSSSLHSNFALNNLSLSLASATVSHIGLSSSSRLLIPKGSNRLTRRPSTASSAEEKSVLLPSSSFVVESSSRGYATTISSPASFSSPNVMDQSRADDRGESSSVREFNRRANVALADLRAEASRLSDPREYYA